jgi:hypothetical protein
VCHMRRESYSSWFDHADNSWWDVNIIKLLIMQSTPVPSYIVPPRLKYPPQHPILEHPQPMFLLQRPAFKPTHKATGKNTFSKYPDYIFMDSKREWIEW